MKKDWRHQTHRRASIIFGQLSAALSFAPSEEDRIQFLDDPDNSYFDLLDKIYGEDYQLAKLMDTSDLIFHAEGPAAKELAPQLRAMNWLTMTTEKVLRGIGKGVFDALAYSEDTSALARKLDLRCTGIAPGSMYAGFSLENHLPTMIGMDEGKHDQAIREILEAFKRLTVLPNYIDDERLSSGVVELVDDPALRDAILSWAHKMCPTGKLGIHTLTVSDDRTKPAAYSQRERTVLLDAIRKPITIAKDGVFEGEIRKADLDNGRFMLRNVPTIGTLRCVFNGTDKELGKAFGKRVKVSGQYEVDHQGRPRLLYVDQVADVRDVPEQQGMDF